VKGKNVDRREGIIYFEDVSYRYPNARPYVLRHLDLTIHKGEFVGVVGENGAGKSTLCQMLNGVIPHSRGGRLRGRVTVAGMDTRAVSIAQLAQRVGIVLEDPEAQLFTTCVLHEVAFGPENLGVAPEEVLRRARWALEVVGLADREDLPPTALSGGQKQRLAIAAALAMQPEVLVLDEATSQLDPVGTRELFAIVSQLNRQHGMTIVMATNVGEEIARFGDRLLVLHEGTLVAQGSPREIFADRELMERVMIRSPQVSQLAVYLARRGIELPTFPVTLEEAQQAIEMLLGGGP
jgi:energy-coupling factor transporter ATP-binding protein EcfA2